MAGALTFPSVTSPTISHSPSRFSFHKVTLLSPVETAKILPEVDQLTLQTTSGNGSFNKYFLFHEAPGAS